MTIEVWIDIPKEDMLEDSKKDEPLWYSCQDEEGNTYYYNTETGECSWILPTEMGGIDIATCPPGLLSSIQKLFEGKIKLLDNFGRGGLTEGV